MIVVVLSDQITLFVNCREIWFRWMYDYPKDYIMV